MKKNLIIPLYDPVSAEYLYFSSIAGIPFIQRLCWIAKKSGYENTIILYKEKTDGIKDVLNNAPGQVCRYLDEASLSSDTTFVFLKPDIFPAINLLEKIVVPEKENTLSLMEKKPPFIAVRVSDISKLSEVVKAASNINSLHKTLAEIYPASISNMNCKDYYSVANHNDILKVEKNLYKGLIKETDSFMARHINRKISIAITRQLINRSITPNAMSLISIMIGISSGYFLSFTETSFQVFGSLLFLFHSIVDGCDGEIARLKYMESRLGGLLDFWGDNVVHAAVFLGIGLAWNSVTGSALPLWCAGFAIIGVFLSAGLVYYKTMKSKKDTGPLYTSISLKEKKDIWVKIADYLSRRDFIYLVVILAIVGKLHWLLVMAALGAPAFFLFTIWSNLNVSVGSPNQK